MIFDFSRFRDCLKLTFLLIFVKTESRTFYSILIFSKILNFLRNLWNWISRKLFFFIVQKFLYVFFLKSFYFSITLSIFLFFPHFPIQNFPNFPQIIAKSRLTFCLFFQVKMGGWKLETGRFLMLITFPVGAFWLFNQPTIFKEFVSFWFYWLKKIYENGKILKMNDFWGNFFSFFFN